MSTFIRAPLARIVLAFILMLGCRDEEVELLDNSHLTLAAPIASDHTMFQANVEISQLASANGNIKLLTKFNHQLIVAGDFTTIGGTVAKGIAAFNGTTWSSLGEGFPIYPNYDHPEFRMAGRIEDVQEYRGELYVTGLFNTIGGVNSLNLARWNGVKWNAVGRGIDYGGYGEFISDAWSEIGGFSLEIFNNELYIGGGSYQGKFTLAKWDGEQLIAVTEYPGVARTFDMITFGNSLYGDVQLGATRALARFDGIRWAPVRKQYEKWEGMEVYLDKLYGRLGNWDGNQFERFAYPLKNIHSIKSIGNNLYVLGGNNLNDAENPSVIGWNGAEWSILYDGVEGDWISSMEEYQGSIYLSYSRSLGEHRGGIVVLE